jgi:sporulation protein YlmC with PRC-barrel domain
MEVHMMLKTGAGVAVLTLMLGGAAALAQTSPAPTTPPPAAKPAAPVTGQILTQDANTVLAKDLMGANVYAPDKTKIGSISDLILAKDGRTVEGFVIGVGGFLGIGEKSVALKMDRLQISQGTEGGVQLMMDVKKDELANAPSFKSRKDQDAEKQAAERARNQPQPGSGPATRPTKPGGVN